MPLLKIVFDTNVIVSATLKPEGLERTALIFGFTNFARFFYSKEILAEYEEVLNSPELKIPHNEAKTLLDRIKAAGQLSAPSRKLTISSDPDDNIFLECAEACRADYLITGNKKHFPIFWNNTKIINARELLEIIIPQLSG